MLIVNNIHLGNCPTFLYIHKIFTHIIHDDMGIHIHTQSVWTPLLPKEWIAKAIKNKVGMFDGPWK